MSKKDTIEHLGIDRYVQTVKDKFEQRSQTGIRKYNTTLERTDLSTLDWINHAQEEAMDFILYLERLRTEFLEQNGKSTCNS